MILPPAETAAVGVVSVMGMLTIIGFTDHVAIMPENAREWREAAEYAASIMLAYATGNVLAALAQRIVPRTLDASSAPSPAIVRAVRILSGPAGEQALRRRAQKVSDNLGTVGTALGAVGTAGASLFAGLRVLFGGADPNKPVQPNSQERSGCCVIGRHSASTWEPSGHGSAQTPMNDKMPVPCEHCHGTGVSKGIECSECGGKGGPHCPRWHSGGPSWAALR